MLPTAVIATSVHCHRKVDHATETNARGYYASYDAEWFTKREIERERERERESGSRIYGPGEMSGLPIEPGRPRVNKGWR